MLYLVLSLLIIIPLNVSGFAVKITGEQGVDGFRNRDDVTVIDVVAESPVRILRGGNSYPMDCSSEDGVFTCHHEFDKSIIDGVLCFLQ